jgi:hypothetical protein
MTNLEIPQAIYMTYISLTIIIVNLIISFKENLFYVTQRESSESILSFKKYS